jgi:trehalose/maltose hydrolase-like predicted phosphorylase
MYDEYGARLAATPQTLYEEHRTAWRRAYGDSGWVSIRAVDAYTQALRAAAHSGAYYLLSSVAPGPVPAAVSPCGIPGFCYNGHVFW